MDEIHVQEMIGSTAEESEVEIVERKGLGHPDTICDLVMDRVSQALCQAYTKHCGRILHHNCDKGLLVAGQVERRFGGGRVIEPMQLIIGDRATLVREFNVVDVAAESARRWFRDSLPGMDPERHLKIRVELKGGSEELTGIFREPVAMAPANDTSAAVGYAPLTETERFVLEAERYLYAMKFKINHPEGGTDVKVMAVRIGEQISLTVAMPLLDKWVANEDDYFRRKVEIRQALVFYLKSRLRKIRDITVAMNTLDRRIYHEVPGLREVVVWLCSRIGDPVDQPQVASVQAKLEEGVRMTAVAEPIRRIVAPGFTQLPSFCQALAEGKYPVC